MISDGSRTLDAMTFLAITVCLFPLSLLSAQEDRSTEVALQENNAQKNSELPIHVSDFRGGSERLRRSFLRVTVMTRQQQSEDGTGAVVPFQPASGMLLDSGGNILTVGDVLEGVKNVSVENDVGDVFLCRVIGYDAQTNVGVICARENDVGECIEVLEDEAKIAQGMPVFALGNSLGQGPSLTAGHITATRRSIESRGFKHSELLQVSLSVNPGDQGGPVADAEGKVVGMLLTRLVYASNLQMPGEVHGIAYAIPIHKAREIAQRLIEMHDSVAEDPAAQRPWLGVRAVEVEDDALRSHLELKKEQGILIQRVYRGSPAHIAGMRQNDIVLQVGVQVVRGVQHFGVLVNSMGVGEEVTLTLIRGGQQESIVVVIGNQ